jgi:hypothetical protein
MTLNLIFQEHCDFLLISFPGKLPMAEAVHTYMLWVRVGNSHAKCLDVEVEMMDGAFLV